MQPRPYDPEPRYPLPAGTVLCGWTEAAATLPDRPAVLAVDGPPSLDWKSAIDQLQAAVPRCSGSIDVREHYVEWETFTARTSSAELADDPDFARLATAGLRELFDVIPTVRRPTDGVLVVFGPGAALLEHDVLWYADLPKRYAEDAVTNGSGCNLGSRPDGPSATTRRLFYIDWPMLDRHRDGLLDHLDRWVDCRPDRVTSVDGATLRVTAAMLAHRPFRTRPTFNTTPWGGHWGQRQLGMNTEAPNTALGYELIAPESGVLIGASPERDVELPFAVVVALYPDQVLGSRVRAMFGGSFPVRFDYLDTIGGDSLSVHCHPQSDYMRRVFGWPYTQHETYYVMETTGDRSIYLGLRGDVDIETFTAQAHAADHHGEPFDIEDHVRVFPADRHQLFLIPAGTPHGSGEGNVVLEVSATPYLYSLRFYDWLRRGLDGTQRPVHVGHAFANLNAERRGDDVAHDLIQAPRLLRKGPSWSEELLGALPEMFFQVRRLVIDGDDRMAEQTTGGFHVLTVVEGGGVLIRSDSGDEHVLSYAETMVVPAAVGGYTLTRIGDQRVRLVKAVVP